MTPHDAARYWSRFEGDTYDCILVDAPCTSERHVVQQAASDAGRGSKSRWSLHQCKEMAALQVKLLTAALKVGYKHCTFCRLLHACHLFCACCTAHGGLRHKPCLLYDGMVSARVSQEGPPSVLTILALWSKAFIDICDMC